MRLKQNHGEGRITEGYYDPSVTELLIDGVDILDIRPLDPRHAKSVLVLCLEGDHGSAIGDLCVCDDSADIVDIVLSSL